MAVFASFPASPDTFAEELSRRRLSPPERRSARVLQVNLGKYCNQACQHCHVDASPARAEKMERATAEQVVRLLRSDPAIEILDLTGGAPELNDWFRLLVDEGAKLGRHVIDRCNLTVLSVAGQEDLPRFLAARNVELVASLPCYTQANVDRQRGSGSFRGSIEALRRLNTVGFGMPDSGLTLNLVYNPLGAFLPGPQNKLEEDYRKHLGEDYGIQFNRLLTIANMPIARFADQLRRWGKFDDYMALLLSEFNESTLPGLMCSETVSVSWDGYLYDCDFNQMVELPVRINDRPAHISSVGSLQELRGAPIVTATHCLGCTAGAGSSCRGALA